MKTAAAWLYVLAGLVGIAAAIVGVLLMTHSTQTCDTQFFCTSGHPFIGAGAGVLIGGVINALVIATIAHLCEVISDLRDYRDADAAVVLEQMGESPTMYGRKD